jgi:putative phosphotransacetylase
VNKDKNFTVPIAVSSRHIHLTQNDVEILFGKGYELTIRNELRQKGQFAANECVEINGPKGKFEKVRIVGPTRAYTQLEVSETDARTLGVKASISYAGQAKDAASVTLVGPQGRVERSCAIIAARHLHTSPEDAAHFGVKDKEIISVKIDGPRAVTFENIVVRVDPTFVTEIHLDTDEGNAAGILPGTTGELIK